MTHQVCVGQVKVIVIMALFMHKKYNTTNYHYIADIIFTSYIYSISIYMYIFHKCIYKYSIYIYIYSISIYIFNN